MGLMPGFRPTRARNPTAAIARIQASANAAQTASRGSAGRVALARIATAETPVPIT
ncbi:hypothetical protein D3C83_273890 [compost metagenome]